MSFYEEADDFITTPDEDQGSTLKFLGLPGSFFEPSCVSFEPPGLLDKAPFFHLTMSRLIARISH